MYLNRNKRMSIPFILASPGYHQPCYWHSRQISLWHPAYITHLPGIGKANGDLQHNCIQYYSCWCPGSLCRQAINNHDIDYVGWAGPCLSRYRISSTCLIAILSNDRKSNFIYISLKIRNQKKLNKLINAMSDNSPVRHLFMDLSQKSHDTPFPHPTIHHFATEICTRVHISVTKWCIVGYIAL